MTTLVPIGTHDHPLPLTYRAVRVLPRSNVIDGEEEVVIVVAFLREVQYVYRRDQSLDGEGVGMTIDMIPPGDPMHGCIEVRAGMLSQFEPIPRPKRTVYVVLGYAVYFHGGGVLGKIRW